LTKKKAQQKKVETRYAVINKDGFFVTHFDEERGGPWISTFPHPFSKLEARYIRARVPFKTTLVTNKYEPSEEEILLRGIFTDGTLLEQEAKKYFAKQKSSQK
jgi:hypothetical protein